MPKAQLNERIQELLGELEQIEAVDQAAREQLTSVLSDIREAIAEEGGEETSDESESLLERLNEATRHFEESHPTLTAMVGRVAESLSNLGI
jgi:predicted transcriptional regulator